MKKRSSISDGKLENYICRKKCVITPHKRYRRIDLFGGKSDADSNTDVYFMFHVSVYASHLNAKTYSQYQQFLYDKIVFLKEEGWTFLQIADWLGENGYKTVRGKKFRSTHVHSIVKKKRIRDERLTKRYEPRIYDFGLWFIDKTMVNSID